MSDYVIYGFYNAQEIAGVLNSVVMLMGSTGVGGDYLSLIRVAAMLGMFIAIGAAFLKHRGEDAAKYLIFMALFYSTLFVPRVNVVIEDRALSAGAPIPVNNVPIGLAFFASTTSHIGAWLAEQSETFFSLPDSSLRMSQSGVLGGPRALREAGKAGIADPILAQDMAMFMRDCINPELVNTPALVPAMFDARNIVQFIDDATIVNPGRMAVLSGTGAINCSAAWIFIKAAINAEANSQLLRISLQFSPHMTQANAAMLFRSLLPVQEAMMMTASGSAAESVRQRMMINALNETSGSMASILNDPSASTDALGAAMAASSANSSYRIMAALSRETLPIIRSAIELVVYGVFPIILVIIVVAGTAGGMILRSYVMTMLWVQMWAPLYAIVNYVGTMAASRNAAASLGGVDGITINNAAALQETVISSEAVVGILTISVPIIAMALIKGGEMAMTSMASGLTSPADRAAAKSGEQAGTGNISLGNTSWGNYSANNGNSNKSDHDFSYKEGAATTRTGSWTSTTFDNGETRTSAATNSGPLSLDRVNQLADTFSQKAGAATRAAESKIAAVTSEMGASMQNMIAAFEAGDRTNTNVLQALSKIRGGNAGANYEQGAGTSDGASSTMATGAGNRTSTQVSASVGTALETVAKLAAAALGMKQPITSTKGGPNIPIPGVDLNQRKDLSRDFSKKWDAMSKDEQSEFARRTLGAMTAYGVTDADFKSVQSGRTGGEKRQSASLSEMKKMSETGQAQLEEAKTFEAAATKLKQDGGSASWNSTGTMDGRDYKKLVDSIEAARDNPEQLRSLLSSMNATQDPSRGLSDIGGGQTPGSAKDVKDMGNSALESVASTGRNDVAAAWSNYRSSIPVGKVGAGSVNMSPEQKAAIEGFVKSADASTGEMHDKFLAQAKSSVRNVIAETGMNPENDSVMTTKLGSIKTMRDMLAEFGAGTLGQAFSQPAFQQFMKDQGIPMYDANNPGDRGPGNMLRGNAPGRFRRDGS